MRYSAAMSTQTAETLVSHLARGDGQEDLCFALWRSSQGSGRFTSLIGEPILPIAGDRQVHGNASFNGGYFERALGIAMQEEAGLAFLHAHPGGIGWQDMSDDDVAAERGIAAQVLEATGRPLVGLTLGTRGDSWSARRWDRAQPGCYERRDFETVRVVGERLRVTYDERQRPRPRFLPELARTTSAWGPDAQASLARLRVGVVGTGSVGALVAEGLARTGIQHIRLIDFDSIETVNRDRLLHSTRMDVLLQRSKVETIARSLGESATAEGVRIDGLEYSVVEEEGYRAALDCDVLFSCVDRPWPRHVLNLIAYAHLIPVIDGGIAVERFPSGDMRGAHWRTHIAGPTRRCLQCLGQYDPGLVQAERDGFFDDPRYIESLPGEHPMKANENVFAFSMSCAAFELGQFISMVVAPNGVADYGARTYRFVTASLEEEARGCEPKCPFTHQLLGFGDDAGVVATGDHRAAQAERGRRRLAQGRWRVRLVRSLEDLGEQIAPTLAARLWNRSEVDGSEGAGGTRIE